MSRLAWKLLSLVKMGWLMVGLFLVFAILLELVAAVSLRLVGGGPPELPPGAPRLYEELGSPGQEWRPYVYWRTRPYSGRHLNIDADGLRRTWNPAPGDTDAMRVFMFGASTLLGFKVRDDYTTPSFVAKIMARECEVPVVVSNFGQLGYVSTQDLIALLLELQRGNVPGVAVFYNGTVDVESSYDTQVAGLPRWEYLRRDAFQNFKHHLFARPTDAVTDYASPALAEDLTGLPPALIIYGENEPVRAENEPYIERLREQGVSVESLMVEGQAHAVYPWVSTSGNQHVLDAAVHALTQAFARS